MSTHFIAGFSFFFISPQINDFSHQLLKLIFCSSSQGHSALPDTSILPSIDTCHLWCSGWRHRKAGARAVQPVPRGERAAPGVRHHLTKLHCQQIRANTAACKTYRCTQAWDFKIASRSILLSLLSWERGDRKGGAELEDWLAEWKDRLSPLTYHLSVRIRAEDCNFLVNAL